MLKDLFQKGDSMVKMYLQDAHLNKQGRQEMPEVQVGESALLTVMCSFEHYQDSDIGPKGDEHQTY